VRKMSITEFAETLGVIPDTVRRWERSGKISPDRTQGGHRRYTEKDLNDALGITTVNKERRKVIYCRVSEKSKPGELDKQIEAMEIFALGRGIIAETITEIGDGVDMARPKFVRLVMDIIKGDIETVIVAHSDRLTRFGYELIESIAKNHNCELLVVNSERLSPHSEVVEDLMHVIHEFSHRIEGLRKIKHFAELVGDGKTLAG